MTVYGLGKGKTKQQKKQITLEYEQEIKLKKIIKWELKFTVVYTSH